MNPQGPPPPQRWIGPDARISAPMYGMPPAYAAATPAMRAVFGVLLEPTERVVYFRRNPTMAGRIGLVVVGVLFSWLFGLGIFLIYLAITDRKQSHYAQAITNKRLLAIDGHGVPKFQIRWDEVAGMNKVAHSTGMVKKFGVRNHAGQEFLFLDDLATVERVIVQLMQAPHLREAWPEVPYQPFVD